MLDPSGRPNHYLQGRVARALTACSERGSSTWHHPLEEGAVIGSAFDDGVHDTGHLGGYGNERFSSEVGVVLSLAIERSNLSRKLFRVVRTAI